MASADAATAESPCLPLVAELAAVTVGSSFAIRQGDRIGELAILVLGRHREVGVDDEVESAASKRERCARISGLKPCGGNGRAGKQAEGERHRKYCDPTDSDCEHCRERWSPCRSLTEDVRHCGEDTQDQQSENRQERGRGLIHESECVEQHPRCREGDAESRKKPRREGFFQHERL